MSKKTNEDTNKNMDFNAIKFYRDNGFQEDILIFLRENSTAAEFGEMVELLNRLAESRASKTLTAQIKDYHLDLRDEAGAKAWLPMMEEAERLAKNLSSDSASWLHRPGVFGLNPSNEREDDLMTLLGIWETILDEVDDDEDEERDFEFVAALAVISLYRRSSDSVTSLNESGEDMTDVFAAANNLVSMKNIEIKAGKKKRHLDEMINAVTIEMLAIIYTWIVMPIESKAQAD